MKMNREERGGCEEIANREREVGRKEGEGIIC